MILLELFQKTPSEFQDLSQDGSQLKFTDARKTRLTLSHINRLRKMNDMRALEHAKEMQLVKQMYGAPPVESGL
jgi:hypothetical protein